HRGLREIRFTELEQRVDVKVRVVRHLPGRLLGLLPTVELREETLGVEPFDLLVLRLRDGAAFDEAVQIGLDRAGAFVVGPGRRAAEDEQQKYGASGTHQDSPWRVRREVSAGS